MNRTCFQNLIGARKKWILVDIDGIDECERWWRYNVLSIFNLPMAKIMKILMKDLGYAQQNLMNILWLNTDW